MKQKTWHDTFQATRSFGDFIADKITAFVGSWTFVGIHVMWFTCWIVFNVEPFPFGLLTLIVSLEAIFLSTAVLMNANRQSDRDRANAEADFQTNKEAKLDIENLQNKLATIETEKLDKILAILDGLVSDNDLLKEVHGAVMER